MMAGINLHIRSGFYLYLASLFLVLPFPWLMAMLAASILHEAGHLAAIKFMKIPINAIYLEPGTARIVCAQMSRKQEFWAAFAGPGMGMLLLFLFPIFPKLAVCGLVQTAFNMLPVFPFDGGRMLRCVLGQGRGEKILIFIKYFTALLMMIFSVVSIKLSFLVFALLLFVSIRCIYTKIV